MLQSSYCMFKLHLKITFFWFLLSQLYRWNDKTISMGLCKILHRLLPLSPALLNEFNHYRFNFPLASIISSIAEDHGLCCCRCILQTASEVMNLILQSLIQTTAEANSLALLISVGYKPLPSTVKDKCLI